MCGITGFINLEKDIQNSYYIIRNMCKTLSKRGPDEEGFYFSRHGVLGHRRLSIIDIQNGKQPMNFMYQGNTYVIVYNGQIYNTNEIRGELLPSNSG